MTKIIAILGAVVVVGAVGVFLFTNKTEAPTVTTNEENSEEMTTPRTLKALLALGGNRKCTFSTSTNTADSSGIVYLAGGKMRGDFDSRTKTGAQTTMMSHMIADNAEARVWVEGETKGYIFAMADIEKYSGNAQTNTVSMDSEVDFDCDMWTPDVSVFVPPTSVTFQSMADIMNAMSGGASGSADMKAQQCAACDQAGANKAACRAALGCS